jgi:hypothetical protein
LSGILGLAVEPEQLDQLRFPVHRAFLRVQGNKTLDVGCVGEARAQHGQYLVVARAPDRRRQPAIGLVGQQSLAGLGPFDPAPQPVAARREFDDPAAGGRLAAARRRQVGGMVHVDRQFAARFQRRRQRLHRPDLVWAAPVMRLDEGAGGQQMHPLGDAAVAGYRDGHRGAQRNVGIGAGVGGRPRHAALMPARIVR